MRDAKLWRSRIALLHLTCWLLIGLLIIGIAGGIARANVNTALCVFVWLMPTIAGSAGVFVAMTSEIRAWPNAAVATAMVVVTPGLFLNLVPNPLLLMVITADIPGWSTMPIRTTIGILLILVMGAAVALGVATFGNRLVRRYMHAKSSFTRGLTACFSFLVMLLIYHLISPLILTLVYFLGLYSEIGGSF